MTDRKLLYSMGEVAEMFDVNASLIRFWERRFEVLRPQKNRKGNRLFSAADIENLKQIYHLVKECGMTIDGARRALKSRSKSDPQAELLERLHRVRALLDQVRIELREGPVEEPPAVEPTSHGVQVIEPLSTRTDAPEPVRAPREKQQELFPFYEQSLFGDDH